LTICRASELDLALCAPGPRPWWGRVCEALKRGPGSEGAAAPQSLKRGPFFWRDRSPQSLCAQSPVWFGSVVTYNPIAFLQTI
jgi:hypothetical protein